MAQEVVVKESLSESMIQAGAELVEQLDRMGWKISAALWFYRTEAGTWRLLLASDEVSSKGPREAYTVVQRALADLGGTDHGLSLDEVAVIATDHPLIQPLRTFSGTVPGISRLRLSRSVVDGHYIDDALIYRIV